MCELTLPLKYAVNPKTSTLVEVLVLVCFSFFLYLFDVPLSPCPV